MSWIRVGTSRHSDVDTAREVDANIIALYTLMTTTMDAFVKERHRDRQYSAASDLAAFSLTISAPCITGGRYYRIGKVAISLVSSDTRAIWPSSPGPWPESGPGFPSFSGERCAAECP